MDKLIIQHGDRVTEHEIGEHPLIIGRDPQCDLFFADKKLSRRHARFERAGKDLRLVDLDSRNGSWVNEERVETRLVTAGDSMRLGSLNISLLTESEPEEDSTVYLTAETSGSDESRTVMLSSEALSAAALGAAGRDANEVVEDAGDATMMLPTTDTLRPPEHEDASSEPDEPDEPKEEAPTLYRPEGDSTVMLESATLPEEGKTGEVIFRGKVEPSLAAATRILSPEILRESHDDTGPDGKSGSVNVVSDEPSSAHETRTPGRRARGSLRFVALVAAISVLAIAVLSLPLMRTLGGALAAESSHRARALVYLLAATNVAALSQRPPGARSLERVIDEPGVVAAYILDRSGNVLAPEGGDVSSLPKDALEDAAGLSTPSTRDLVNGDVLIMTPIASDAGPIGLAVLQFRAPTVTSWSTLILVLGALLLLMGVGAAVLLARRWTLGPVRDLRDDVLALREGLPGTLPEERPYSELTDLARSFNELLEQRSPPRGDDASSSGLDATVIRER